MNIFSPKAVANSNGRRSSISRIFHDALHQHDAETISIGDLADILGPRGYGVLILFLNLPNLIPAPLPGISTIFGIPIALIALQLMIGKHTPWLPHIIRNRSVPTGKIRHLFERAEPYLNKLERFLKPRLFPFTTRWAWHFYGLIIFVMACVMAMPIPLGNLILALPISLMALGLVERDGLLLIGATIISMIGLIWNIAIVAGIFTGIGEILQQIF